MSRARPIVKPHPELHGVVRISAEASLPRPRVLVLGSVHGDEPCGVEALQRLNRDAESGVLSLDRGTVVTVHANPDASAQGLRYTETGQDLNRLLDWQFAEDIPEADWAAEHRRAWALKPLLEDADALIDLHSASATTPPFVITNGTGTANEIGVRLGVEHVTHGMVSNRALGARTTIGLLARFGRPALGVECGQHADPEAPEIAHRCALRFLAACQVLGGETPEPQGVTEIEVFQVVRKPSTEFRFAWPVRGLERIESGTVIGSDEEQQITAEQDCYAVLPNDEVPPGGDMLYLARERS